MKEDDLAGISDTFLFGLPALRERWGCMTSAKIPPFGSWSSGLTFSVVVFEVLSPWVFGVVLFCDPGSLELALRKECWVENEFIWAIDMFANSLKALLRATLEFLAN